VIIVQADHGTASLKNHDIAAYKQSEFIRERMPILNAYYVGGACRQRLYRDISPVNTFRLLFNSLFDESFERLPDRHYFAWYGRPYKLRDVTHLFRANEPSVAAGRSAPESIR
jgi:hypothetical protein